MTMKPNDCADGGALRLDSQLCFPLYACAREVVKRYTPLLEELGLTYTQYITMMVLWEERCATSRRIGQRLHLDSGTLTPVLKKLEGKGLVTRCRCMEDERHLSVGLTEAGAALEARAARIPRQMGACVALSPEEAVQLRALLNRLLEAMERG